MFLYLKHSTIVWLLMQLMDFSYQTTHGHLFPSFPKEISGESFTVDFKYNGLSDLIYAKCPGPEYYHSKIKDGFNRNEKLRGAMPYLFSDNQAFIWIPMVYNMSGPTSIFCGKLQLSINNSINSENYEWHFNLEWKNKPDPIKMALPRTISTQLPNMKKKCGNEQNKTFIYFKDKKNGIKIVNLKDKILGHANDLYYYFRTPDNDEKLEMVEPCVIVKAIYNRPEIIIKGHNSTSISSNNLDLHVIKQDHVAGLYSIQLYLEDEIKVPDFYEGEKVKMTKVKFRRTGIEEVPNSDETVTSAFTLKGFQLVKFSYDWPTLDGAEKVERIFYFGPRSESYVFPNRHTIYLQNETAIQPNCSIHRISFGYLDSVTVDNSKVHLSELKDGGAIKNNLKRVKDFVFMTNVDKENVTLHCFYITPNGNVTLVETFIHGVKVVVGYGSDGEAVHEFRVESAENKKLKDVIAEKDKQLAAKDKSIFQKLEGRYGTTGAYAIVIIAILVGSIGTVVILILCLFKVIKPWIKTKIVESKHPNIFVFWNEMSKQIIDTYTRKIQDDQYIPDKVKDQKGLKVIEGGEEVEGNVTSYFNNSLVSCYKDINGEINAHYIKDISPLRTYIISNGPRPEKVEYFWELLYREDVGVVVAIINQKTDEILTDVNKACYWPKSKQSYGKINVEYMKDEKTEQSHVSITKFKMTMAKGETKELTIFHVSNWNEYEIPRCDTHLIKLYHEVVEHAGSKKVLVHSSHGSGSRVYMFTYFCCIFEAMKEDTTMNDPLEIIKKIREQRFGGNIAFTEFAYTIKALVSYFFKTKILTDKTNHQSQFYEEYDNFMYYINNSESSMDYDFKNFLSFVNILDNGKLYNICDQFMNIEIPSKESLLKKCTRFYAVNDIKSMKKIRYPDIPCYDAGSMNIKGKNSKDVEGFIHANEMVYKYGEKQERKIIMCQAPLKETMEDMFDMLHRHDIGVLVMIINQNEMKNSKCFPYLYTKKPELSYGNFNLLYRGHTVEKNNYYVEYDYSIISSTRLVRSFKLLHYTNWPDNNAPNESKSIHGLYKRIIELSDHRPITIHCSNGVGKTGTLALIIYMIDIINSKMAFDPIKCLVKIRQHRYKAVQTTKQLAYALSILCEHFKEKIDEMDKDTYSNCMFLIREYCSSKDNK
uniref:Protein-tyrosine-phosphatase n=2 Tax=Strongyloides stercoralis TaxID=6248 RepID=A0AAF5HXZ5_STRER